MNGLYGIRAINAAAQAAYQLSREQYRKRDLPARVNHTVDQIEPGVWVGTVQFDAPGLGSVSTQPFSSSAEATIACARIACEKGYRI
jgi:hypothetical protein